MEDNTMADIIGWTIVALMVIGFLRLGMGLGRHILNPPRDHSRADKDIDKIIEDRVEATLARRGAR